MLRDMPHLTKYMPRAKDARRLIPDPDNEPNFYAISRVYPVPPPKPEEQQQLQLLAQMQQQRQQHYREQQLQQDIRLAALLGRPRVDPLVAAALLQQPPSSSIVDQLLLRHPQMR